MPCATVHLHLSDRILLRWEREPGSAPFPATDLNLREAFRHGSLAPDMGFVPGVDRLVSELAHYVDPAELTRSIFRRAGSPEEEAFAWGWASHVLGDVILHPMVGRAVGERIHGDRQRRVNAEEDLPTHVGMEVGLDLALLERSPGISPPPEAPFFEDGNVGLLTGALEATYGLPWTRREVLVGHHRAVRLTAFWPRAIRLVADGKPARGSLRRAAAAGLGLVRRAGRRLAGSESSLRGFLTPIEPPPWLVDSVLSCGEEIPDLIKLLVRDGPEALDDRNLETGEAAGPGLGHPPSDRAVRELERRRNGALARGPSGGGPGDGIL